VSVEVGFRVCLPFREKRIEFERVTKSSP
jgi:hypothetical protein